MYSQIEIVKLLHCQEEVAQLKNFHAFNLGSKESEVYEVLCLFVITLLKIIKVKL